MTKEKLKRLPFNIFWCLTSFFAPYIILPWFGLDDKISLGIAIFIYLSDIEKQNTEDVLLDRIKKLEEKVK